MSIQPLTAMGGLASSLQEKSPKKNKGKISIWMDQMDGFHSCKMIGYRI